MYRTLIRSSVNKNLLLIKSNQRLDVSSPISRLISSKSTNIKEVTIGNITKEIKTRNTELVPKKFCE